MSETASIGLSDLQWLHRLARLMAQSPDDADDLVQDTLITAWQRPPADREDLRPWLGTVLRNRLRMVRRSSVRRDARERAHDVPPAAPAPPDHELTRVSVLRHLMAELEQLPPEDQRLIVRRFFEGHSAADISRALDIPAATIRSRIRRSLERLRARLDERCDGRDAWCAAVLAIPIPGEAIASAGPTGGKDTMIKATMALVVVGGTAAGVMAVGGTGADDGQLVEGVGDVRTPERQRDELAAESVAVAAAPTAAATEDAAPDAPQAQWAERKDAIRSVLDAAGPDGPAKTGPKHTKMAYAKLIRACIRDLEDVPATLSVKLTEIGAPDLGTIVASAEVVATSIDNPAVTECVEQSMYAYVGDAPDVAYERSYRFGVALPGKKFTPETLDMMFAQQMANRYPVIRRCEPEGVRGHIELQVTVGSGGKTEKVEVTDSSVDASVGTCLTRAAADWNFLSDLAGKPRRYRYELPVQAPVIRRE